MSNVVKSVLKVILMVAIVIAGYAIGLEMRILPFMLTPQALFKDKYPEMKGNLAKNVADNTASAAISQMILDFLVSVEENYAKQSAQNTNDNKSAEDKPTEPGAVTKARATMQQYQNKIDEQKKELDSL